MAAIRKRGKRYHVQIRKKGHPPLTRSFLSLSDARAWARKVESEIERGMFIDVSKEKVTTVADLLNRFEKEVLLPQSNKAYRDKSRTGILKKALGSIFLSDLRPFHLAAYMEKRGKQVGCQALRHELGLLRRILNTAQKEWGIQMQQRNPVSQVRLPKPPQGRERRLEAGEESCLLSALRGSPQVSAIVSLAIETAMRRGEIAQLEWRYIDLHKRTLYIPRTKTEIPRTIPLSIKAVSILQRFPMQLDGRVFSIKADSITQAFQRACKRSGIEGLRFHDLRHEATSRLFEKGLSLMEVATITGHRDLRMLKRYTHLRAEDLVRKLG